MSENSRTVYQGLLVPDERIKHANISAADSSYTQASPRPGVPSDDSAIRSDMVLEASGTQSSGGDLTIQAIQGGFPGRQERGGGFGWVDTGASKTAYLGWDTPASASGFEWNPYSASSGNSFSQPCLVKLADESVLQASRHDTGSVDAIKVRKYSGSSWSLAATITVGAAGFATANDNIYPCMVALPTGRVLLFAWVLSSSISQANIRMWYSDDDGASWTVGSRFCLRTQISTSALTPNRLRAAYSRGQILMMGDVRNGSGATTLFHFASADLGTTFRQVATTSGLVFPDVVALASGGFLVQYSEQNASAEYHVRVKRLGSAYSLLSTASAVTLHSSSAKDPHCLWQSDDGTLYSLRVDDSNTGTMSLARSTDAGLSWANMSDSPFIAGTSAFGNMCAVEAYGRAFVAFDVVRDDSAFQHAIGLLYLGGYSTITMPMAAATTADEYQHGWDRTWGPIEAPTEAGYTASAGATTSTTASGYHQIVTTSSETKSYGKTHNSTLSVGIVGRFRLVGVDGRTSPTDDPKIAIKMQVGDTSSASYAIHISITEVGFRVVDPNASALATVTVDTTSGIEFLATVYNDDAAVWYRTATTPAREWTLAASSTGLTSGGSGNHQVYWGHLEADGTLTSTTQWAEAHYSLMATGDMPTFSSPTDLFARPFSRSPVYVHDGVRIAAVDGPAIGGGSGDTWSVVARHDYGVELVDPANSPSPRERWRSLNDDANQVLAWSIESTPASLGSPVCGIYLGGINFFEANLAGYNGSAWVTLATVDPVGVLTGLEWTRYGNSIEVTTTGGDDVARYIAPDELAGGSFRDTTTGDVYRITGNTDGIWKAGATRRPVLYLEAGASGATTGTAGQIAMPSVLVPWRHSARISKIRLTIPSQTTADGDIRVGTACIGPIFVFGTQYSRGRELETMHNTDLATSATGGRSARVAGPTRRSVSFAWAEGVDTSQLFAAGADYGKFHASDDPAAITQAAPLMIDGLFRQLDGPAKPVVYCPRLVVSEVGTSLPALGESLYGRIVSSSVRRASVLGDEAADELQRVMSLTIEEEV
jgi:hypothetical protein